MLFHTRYDLDVDGARISFFVEDVETAAYVLTGNTISIPELLEPIDTNIAAHTGLLDQLVTWANLVEKYLPVSSSNNSPFAHELKIEDSKIKMKFSVNQQLLTDVEYNRETELITWKPHPPATLQWSDLRHWLKILAEFSEYVT